MRDAGKREGAGRRHAAKAHRRNEHQTGDASRRPIGHGRGDAAAERVPDRHEAADADLIERLEHVLGVCRQLRAPRQVRAAEAGNVDGDQPPRRPLRIWLPTERAIEQAVYEDDRDPVSAPQPQAEPATAGEIRGVRLSRAHRAIVTAATKTANRATPHARSVLPTDVR